MTVQLEGPTRVCVSSSPHSYSQYIAFFHFSVLFCFVLLSCVHVGTYALVLGIKLKFLCLEGEC